MSRKYSTGNNRHTHFITFSVINWIDFFTRNEYRNILVKSIEYCQEHKGLKIHSYCIMPSHVHLIASTDEPFKLEHVIRDLKRYTSTSFHKLLKDETNIFESRKSWLLWMMERAGKRNKNKGDFQFWQYENHPIELFSDEVYYQKMEYIHLNPVTSGFVAQPEDWLYSSARNHAGLSCCIRLYDD